MAYIVEVKKGTAGSLTQIASSYYGALSKGKMYYRTCLNGSWQEWESIATTSKTDILFDGSTTTTFNILKSLVGYDEFKVMGYTESYTHSQFTYNSFTFSKLADGESGYLVFGAGNVQFRCSGTTFTVMHNPNNIKITKLIGIKRGDI